MGVDAGFDKMQPHVDVPEDTMRRARERRDAFTALQKAPDVKELVASGSLARGTHKDPLHDVDLICVYSPEDHPAWGEAGDTAEAALDHTSALVHDLVNAAAVEEVRLIRKQNHAIKCFLDDPNDEDAFTVDVTPAIRHVESGFLIPEVNAAQWIRSDPEFLMARVAERHSEWRQFAKLVRVLKRWNTDTGGEMKSLVVEVLALHHLPAMQRPEALARFFTAAAVAVLEPVVDPAGLCGEIQPDLDRHQARAQLEAAADLSWRAVDVAARGDEDWAMCLWRDIFGPVYPQPSGGCAKAKGVGALGGTLSAGPKRKVVDAPQGC